MAEAIIQFPARDPNLCLTPFLAAFQNYPKPTATRMALGILSISFDRSITEQALAIYSEALDDLSAEQLTTAFSRAMLEEKFWTPVAKLRELAGVLSVEERALEDLMALIPYVRQARRWDYKDLTEDPWTHAPIAPLPANILAVIEKLGGRKSALRMIANHPACWSTSWESSGDEKPLLEARQVEQRWDQAYRAVAR